VLVQYADFVMNACGYPKNSGFFSTLLSIGYLRCSIDRLKSKWAVRLGFARHVKLGSPAPDAALLSLRGEKLSLLNDFIKTSYIKVARPRPLLSSLFILVFLLAEQQ
jgi:hypothetical protein